MLSICLDTFEQPPVVALRSEFVCLDGIKCQDLQILIHGIRVSSSGNVMIPVPCHSGIKGSHWKFMFGGVTPINKTQKQGIGIQYHAFAKPLCGGTCVCTLVCLCPHMHVCGGQRWVLGLFLNHFPLYLYIYLFI